jgi:uncharacterized spore protein YtfJ
MMGEENTTIPDGFDVISVAIEGNEQAVETIGRLFDVAAPDAVYARPLEAGEYTVITASEVSVGMGLGFGAGSDDGSEDADPASSGGAGGGGGGGGFSTGRPVAAIEIGPGGVRIEPIVDITKIAIALFAAIGAIFVARNRMRKASRALSE